MEVGEDIVHREQGELASTPEHLAEEVVGVIVVDQGEEETDAEVGVAVGTVELLLDLEHGWSAEREVAVAGGKEEADQL